MPRYRHNVRTANQQFSTEFLKKLFAAQAFPNKNSSVGPAIQVAFSGVPYIYALPNGANLLRCIRELGHNSLLLVNGTALYGCRGYGLKSANAGPQGTPG